MAGLFKRKPKASLTFTDPTTIAAQPAGQAAQAAMAMAPFDPNNSIGPTTSQDPSYGGFPGGGATYGAFPGAFGPVTTAQAGSVSAVPGDFGSSSSYGGFPSEPTYSGFPSPVSPGVITAPSSPASSPIIPSSPAATPVTPGSPVEASPPSYGGFPTASYGGFPADGGGTPQVVTTSQPDVIDRAIHNHPGDGPHHPGAFMDPGAPDAASSGPLASTGHTVMPTVALAPSGPVTAAAPVVQPASPEIDPTDMRSLNYGRQARRIEVTIDSDGTFNNASNPVPATPAAIVPTNVPTLPPQDSFTTPPNTIAGFDPSASLGGSNIHRPGRQLEME